MNIPGFTAEASVCKASGSYHIAGAPNDLARNRGIVPQMSDLCRLTLDNCISHTIARYQTADIWCDVHEAFCLGGS
jgi:hypothetical protein